MNIIRQVLCGLLWLATARAQEPAPAAAPVVAGISAKCLLAMCRGPALAQWNGDGPASVVYEGGLRVGERAPVRYRLAVNAQRDTTAEFLDVAIETSIHGELERIGKIESPSKKHVGHNLLQLLLGHALSAPEVGANRDPIPGGITPLCTAWLDGSRFVFWPSSVSFAPDPQGGIAVILRGECIDIHVSRDSRRSPELVVNAGRQKLVGSATIEIREGKPTVRYDGVTEPASVMPMWTDAMTSLVTGLGNVLRDLRLASGKLLMHSKGTRSWLCLSQDLEGTETQVAAVASGDVFVAASPAYATKLLHGLVPGHQIGNLTLWLAPGTEVPFGAEPGVRQPDSPEDRRAIASSPGIQVQFAKGDNYPRVTLRGSILIAVGGKYIARVDGIDMPFLFEALGTEDSTEDNRVSLTDDVSKLGGAASFHATPTLLAAAGNEIERYKLPDRMTRFVDAAYRALGLLALTNPIPFYESLPVRFGGRSYATALANGKIEIVDIGGTSCLRIHADVAKEKGN